MRPVIQRLLLVIPVIAALSVSAEAQPTAYGRTPVKINCGILLINSSNPGGPATNADPYVFFNMERRTDLKPPGWEFDNPFASSTMTPQMAARWNAVAAGGFSAGQRVTKNMAAYWEVDLSQVSTANLAEYNILLIHAPGIIQLNSLDRQKLQNFIDSGGILWFDKSTVQTMDAYNGLPIPFHTTNAGANPVVLQPLHPILSYPYNLGYFEAAFLGAHNGRHAIVQAQLNDYFSGAYGRMVANLEQDFYKFNFVVSNSAGAVVAVAQMGNGYLVATSGNIVSRINEPAGGTNVGLGANSGPYAGENFRNIPSTELRFAYNVIALAGGHSGLAKGSRRLNSTFDHIGAPLLETWSQPDLDLTQPRRTNYVPPAIYKGLVFVTSGNRLYAYKADMNRDLDNDGWLDDGLQDASLGEAHDLVWFSQPLGAAPLSAPVAVEAANAPLQDQVYVVNATGTVHVFNALPRDANGRLLGPNAMAPVASIAPPSAAQYDTSLDNSGPWSPVFMDGLMYIFDRYQSAPGFAGRVWPIDARTLARVDTGGSPWLAAGAGTPNLPDPGGAATIGLIPVADGATGLDKVLYLPHRSSTLTGMAAGVTSLWAGAKGESPQVTRSPGNTILVTRAASRGLRLVDVQNSSLGLKINLIYDDGTPLTAAETATYLNGAVTQFAPGQLSLTMQAPAQILPDNINVRIDYHIDWGTGAPNLLSQLVRGQLIMPDDVNRRRYTVKSMALAPNGNLFVVTSDEFTNGALFCVREFDRGQFRLIYRWDLYDGMSWTINGSQNVQLPPALEDHDYIVTNMVPYLNAPMRRLHFHGSPTVINNICYVHASGEKATLGGPRITAILAFDANPTRIDVRLPGPIPPGFRMRQPDVAASSNKNRPERSVTLQPAQQADMQTDAGVIRFTNMMSAAGGEMRNAFSTSMPVIISASGQPEQVFDPNTTGSRWSPLLWYFVYNGMENESPPLVMGNTLYMAGGNILPGLFQSPPEFRPRPSLFAMDADIPTNHPSILTIPGRPGLRQVRWLYPDPGSPVGFTSNPLVRWPSAEGVQNSTDFLVRLQQTILGNRSGLALGVVGGDGTIVGWAEQGIFGFNRGTTVVADEGRVIETDSAGFVQWTSDVTYQTARDGGSTMVQTQRLVRPTKAYRSGANEYAIVDTGGNRIVRIDKSAGEVRSIDRISLDAAFRPDGWNEGDPLELTQPRDLSLWGDFVPAANNPLSGASPLEYWVHYLIADTGNRRMIEVVDRYIASPGSFAVGDVVRDASGEMQLGKLVWHTPSNFSGKAWQYTAIQRFQVGINQATGNAMFVYVGAVGDTLPTAVNIGLDPPSGTGPRETGGGAGGLVIFDSVSGGGNQVINQVFVNGVPKTLIGINSVSIRTIGLGAGGVMDIAVMYTDRTGVYEIVRNGSDWHVVWMMPNEAYQAVRDVPLRAAAAKRLLNGHVLITNSYFGRTLTATPQDFFGEVTQWVGDTFDFGQPNFGFSTAGLRFVLPPVVGSRGLRNPQFADRL